MTKDLIEKNEKLREQNTKLIQLVYQYMDDMRYPPNEESRERRLARIAQVMSEVMNNE